MFFRKKAYMIKHVVCFKIKEEHKQNLDKTRGLLNSMKENVEIVKDLEVGVDFLKSPRSYDVFLIVTLENKEDLDIYQADEYLCNVVKTHMHEIMESSVAVDFEGK